MGKRAKKLTRRQIDAAVRRAIDKDKLTCPFPFDSFDECVATVSEGGAEDPEALCAEWERECGEMGDRSAAREREVKTATLHLQVKQVDPDARTFEGLAATWDLDLGGDIIKKGAFRSTLKTWKDSGRVLPLLDSHSWFSVRHAVGRLLSAKETDDGLLSKWRIVPGADGDEILNRLRPDEDGGSFIDSMSIGYKPVRWEIIEEEGDDFFQKRILKEVELHEVSLVLFPMNPGARVDVSTVKALLAGSVEYAVKRYPQEMQQELRRAIGEYVMKSDWPDERTRQDKPKNKPTPGKPQEQSTPAPPEPQPAEPSPSPAPKRYTPSPEVDDNEPDMDLLRQLRFRRLDLSNRLTKLGG